MSKSKGYLPRVPVKIRPQYDFVKSKHKVHPIIYKKKDDIALIIQDKIRKLLAADSQYVANKAASIGEKKTSYEGQSLQSLFLKANEIKNKSSEELKKLKDLDSSSPVFKSLNIQKAVLDKLVNSYIGKINALRVRQGSYTKADENELSLLPSKLQSIDLEYAKMKDMINEHLKDENLTPEEKAKRTAERLYEKLLEMNRILDPKTNQKNLDASIIRTGSEVEQLMMQLNTPELRPSVIAKFQDMMIEFDSKYNEIHKLIEAADRDFVSQSKKRDEGGKNILNITDVAKIEKSFDDIEKKLSVMKAEQEAILKDAIDGSVSAEQVVKFNVNMENINNLVNTAKGSEATLLKTVSDSVVKVFKKKSLTSSQIENVTQDETYKKVVEIVNTVRRTLRLLWKDHRHVANTRSYNYTIGLSDTYTGQDILDDIENRINEFKSEGRKAPTQLTKELRAAKKDVKNKYIRIDVITDVKQNVLFLLKDQKGDNLINVNDIDYDKGDPYDIVDPNEAVNTSSDVFMSLPYKRKEIIEAFIIAFKRYDIGYRQISKHIEYVSDTRLPDSDVVGEIGKFFRRNTATINTNLDNIKALENIYMNVFNPIVNAQGAITREEYDKKYKPIVEPIAGNADWVFHMKGGPDPEKVPQGDASVLKFDDIPDDSQLNPILTQDDKKLAHLQQSFDNKLKRLDTIGKEIEEVGNISNQNYFDIREVYDELTKTNIEIIERRIAANKAKLKKLRAEKQQTDAVVKTGKARKLESERDKYLSGRIEVIGERIEDDKKRLVEAERLDDDVDNNDELENDAYDDIYADAVKDQKGVDEALAMADAVLERTKKTRKQSRKSKGLSDVIDEVIKSF